MTSNPLIYLSPMTESDLVIISDGDVVCKRCLHREKVPVPMSIQAFAKWAKYIQEKHRYCQKPLGGAPCL